ncbi:MAG: toxin-antitoxin system protein [Candidatus Omnitrophica bacterium]|nr:toxin-antitoxin system protein [Candidatus Omnitrophota bacterium]
MKSAVVRIDTATNHILHQIAEQSGQSMQRILNKAVLLYRRERFLDDVNKAYAHLKQDTKAWKEELEERKRWDAALSDDLGNE